MHFFLVEIRGEYTQKSIYGIVNYFEVSSNYIVVKDYVGVKMNMTKHSAIHRSESSTGSLYTIKPIPGPPPQLTPGIRALI